MSASLEPGHNPPSRSPEVTSGWKRWLYLALAGVFFLLGLMGILLPILPTTPFLLLTSYFLVRTSPSLHASLLRSRFFGPILTDWQIRGGVRRDVKAKAIAMVVLFVALSAYVSGYSVGISAAAVVLAAAGIAVILRLPVAQSSPHPSGVAVETIDK